jgi:hypothetical protein
MTNVPCDPGGVTAASIQKRISIHIRMNASSGNINIKTGA